MTNSLYDRIEAIEAFAADVAHELKNPLTSLRSAVDTLPLAKTEAQRERLMELARDDVARIDRLITDISNASRLDAELSRTGNDVINLSALLKSVASHAQAQTAEPDEGGVHILTSDLPDRAFVRGHGEALGRIFHNLLDNARSFSPPGGTILLSTTKEDRDWVVRIKDEGPGIPEDALEQIFDRFYTHRPEHTAFGQHSGLGLSIVRQIVEAHGGSVSASNAEDGGAVFTVRLPRQGLTAARKDTSPRGHGMA
jgi:two-component system sensor histidine kinase ChvG